VADIGTAATQQMRNHQHSWSGQLAQDASSTSRSSYEWKKTHNICL